MKRSARGETRKLGPGLPAPLPAAEVKEMFGQVASRYDLLNHLLSGNLDRFWRRRMVRRSGVRRARRSSVLDVCCGTGDLAFSLAGATGAGSRVIGVDFSREMLQLGSGKERGRARRGTGQPTRFVCGDALRLPFATGQFDLITVAFGIRNVEDPGAGLAEMTRVARPGGQVMVLEFAMPRSRLFGFFYRFYFHRLVPVLGRLISRARVDAYGYLPASVEAFPARERFLELMAGAGLVETAAEEMTFGSVVLYRGRKPDGSAPR